MRETEFNAIYLLQLPIIIKVNYKLPKTMKGLFFFGIYHHFFIHIFTIDTFRNVQNHYLPVKWHNLKI